jgi:hypothetical protein
MSSSKQKDKEVDINIGRGGLGIHSTSQSLKDQQGLIGQSGIVGGQQGNVLISNEPSSVFSQEQRLASNRPIVTEKFVSTEYVPVTHEEIVTTVPIVTGQAVHTGQAIGGEKTRQAVNVEYVKQQAATRVDLMPQVQTQLGAQEVVNIPVNQAPQFVGKTTVISSQQATNQCGGIAGTQPLGNQNFATQPLGAQTCTQSLGAQSLGTQPFGTQAFGQNLTTQATNMCTGTQPLSTPLSGQQTGLGSGTGVNLNVGKKHY